MSRTRTLPKAHLHFHLEASARPETIIEFAARQGIAYSPPTAFTSFDEFNAAYAEMVEFIRTPDDLRRICREIVEDNAADGVRYIEPLMLPAVYTDRFGMSEHEVYALLHDAFSEAGRVNNVEVGILLAGIWSFDMDITESAAHFAAEHSDSGVVGFGLCGVEPQSSYAAWSRPCDIVRDAGLTVIPHAGEFGGPANVRGAIDFLRGDRIAHGVRAAEDPETIAMLAGTGTVCDIAPTSNVVLGVFSDLLQVPVEQFLEAGIRFTINDDDALFFGSRIGNEYAIVQETFGLSNSELATIARTSIDASSAPAETKRRINAEIDEWLSDPES
ncbi:MAG: adenosine deaminase [Chloroflexota bacterium]|nr:adenosine deaminase [Chloroflexota bacterium]